MNKFKEYLIQRCTDFHVKIHYGTSYRANEQGAYERMSDTIRYEELKEIIRNCPDLNKEEIGREVSDGVRKRVGF